MTADNPQGEPAPESVPGSTEKRPRNKHIRDKIRAAVILERLERNALGELEPPMDALQIRSAEITLKKVIPDLQAVQISGDEDGAPINLVHTIERRIVRPAN
jgi:hypothetical protein